MSILLEERESSEGRGKGNSPKWQVGSRRLLLGLH
ncbi:hypothetical protein SAMN04489735_104416 [Aneurinibacillus thermoaerophilus]|uniref:Uncharacterized protein n=1 Tax=Aneurinibacillus thermoaerophilus TaxID=143495 RepID=A0A1G8EHM9_ANETH|nr:hypothetical protein SAMN04489735_104416 [Aneurinibacillus thermoaerophilus]